MGGLAAGGTGVSPALAQRARLYSALVVSAMLLGLALSAPASAEANWAEPFAGPLNIDAAHNVPDTVTPTSIANVAGVPFVAWNESNGMNDEVHVKRLVAGGWTTVGDALNINSVANADEPNVADVGGVPYVAWSESNGSNLEIHVKRFDGMNWNQPVNTSLNVAPGKDAALPTITSVGGIPYVAWNESNGTHGEIYVKQFNGTSWSQVGGALNFDTNHGANHVSIASVGGVPYVAWDEFNGSNGQIFVKRFNGTSWTLVGTGPLNVESTQPASHPSIANVGGVPYVTWDESNGTNTLVHVARFDGSNWTAVGGALNVDVTKDAEKPDIASIGDAPFVAWRDAHSGSRRDVEVKRFSGGTWRSVGAAINDPTENVDRPRIASVAGVPYVAWVGSVNFLGVLRVKRLEPDFLTRSAVPTKTGATLSTRDRTFGVRFPIGFQYGTAFGRQTTTVTAPAGADTFTLTRTVAGLSAANIYKFRPFAIAGVPLPLVLGPIGTFRPDNRPPKLKLSGQKKQQLASKVTVKALCPDEDCALAGRGKVLGFKLQVVHANLKRGVARKIKLKLSQKGRAAVAQALAAGQTVKAKLVFTATDRAGNRTTKRRGVTLL
jgi:hypothetical protein